MGKRVFLMLIGIIVSGLTWFVLDVDVAEMKTFTSPAEAQDAVQPQSDLEATCANEAAKQGLDCRELERRILSTTLRIEIETWIIYVEGEGYTTLSGNGHGTVMGSRYLLTHNHFQLPLLELLGDDEQGQFATVTLYNADGKLVWQGPLTTIAVAYYDAETLLLKFKDRDGRGLFDSLGLPSADFMAGEAPTIAAGATVAQINWDEHQAKVQWTKVQTTFNEGETAVMRLADCLVPGASGGGVFLDGVHIANNWSRSLGCRETGSGDAPQHSTAALNSAELLAAGQDQPILAVQSATSQAPNS